MPDGLCGFGERVGAVDNGSERARCAELREDAQVRGVQALLAQSILAKPALRTTLVALDVDETSEGLTDIIAQRSALGLMAHPVTATTLRDAVAQLSPAAAPRAAG